MAHTPAYFSWLALALALLLWAGVGAFAWQVMQEESERDSNFIKVQEVEAQQASLFKLRTLARETADERARLDNIADKDIVEVLDIVEAISRDARIPIKIGETLAGRVGEDATQLRSATLAVEAQGTFSQVVHAAALLESLPLASSLTELHLEVLPVGTNTRSAVPQWRLIARLTVLTSSEL